MRTRSEIIQSIADKLTSVNWNRLKNSLVGKELIAFGGEVVAAAENVKDTLVDSLDYEKADLAGLVSLSQINDVYVSAFRPAYIKIKVKNIVQPLVYKPFDLVLTSGSSVFTNIDYCSSDDEITLYQGVVKTAVSAGTPEQYSGYRYDTTVPYEITNLPSSDTSVKNYLILGEQAMPESIFLFKRNNDVVSLLPQYTPLRYSSQIEQYKIRTLSDVKQAVQFGDGVWGKSEYDAGTEFQAIWLELSNNEFSTEGTLVSTEYGSYSDSQFEFLASALANYPDVDFARASYKKNMLITSVIASNSQIREFANAYPYVLDSNVVLADSINNLILVYIKPTDQNDIGGFGEIDAALDLYGNIFTQHRTILGLPILFSVLVYANYNSQVQQYLVSKFGYSNLAYKEIIAAAATASEIQSLYQLSNYVLFQVIQAASMLNLMNPIQGSIRLLDGNGVMQGFDSHGLIYKLLEVANQDFLYGFGSSYGSSFLSNHFWDRDAIYAYQNSLFNLYSGDTLASRKISTLLEPEIIFDVNPEIYFQQNSFDSALAGLRLKNETVDEFPIILCSYPLDDVVITEPSELVITNNKDAVAQDWFNTTGVNAIDDAIRAQYGQYITTSQCNYTGCRIKTYPIDYSGWTSPAVHQAQSTVLEVSYSYTLEDEQYGSQGYYSGFQGTGEIEVSLNLDYVVSGGSSSATMVGKAVSLNVFIDSMFWNFPDANANTIQAIRSLQISSTDTMANEGEAEAIVDYLRGTPTSLPTKPFAPKVKFRDDKLYLVVTTSEGLVLYVFNVTSLGHGVSSLNAKVVLTSSSVECNGLVILNNFILIKGSDGVNYCVYYNNGIYSIRQQLTIAQIDSYDECYIYQTKNQFVIVAAELVSGHTYNLHYFTASGLSVVSSVGTFSDFTEITFFDTDGETPIYTSTELHSNGDIWTSCPQIAFMNELFLGFFIHFSQFDGTFISVTAVTYNRQTTEISRVNSDNSGPTAAKWKYPSYSGTVNYDSGEMNPGNINFTTTKYNTSLIQVKENQFYPKLDTTTPVIWM